LTGQNIVVIIAITFKLKVKTVETKILREGRFLK